MRVVARREHFPTSPRVISFFYFIFLFHFIFLFFFIYFVHFFIFISLFHARTPSVRYKGEIYTDREREKKRNKERERPHQWLERWLDASGFPPHPAIFFAQFPGERKRARGERESEWVREREREREVSTRANMFELHYRVAKTHRMPYFHRSLSAKEPYN